MIGENLLGPEPTLLPADDEVTAALAAGAESAPGYPLLSFAIRAGCRAAIALSKRI